MIILNFYIANIEMHFVMLILLIGSLLMLIGAYCCLLVFIGNGRCEKYAPSIESLTLVPWKVASSRVDRRTLRGV